MKSIRYFVFSGLVGAVVLGCTDTNSDKPVQVIDSVVVDTMPKEIKPDTSFVGDDSPNAYSLSQTDRTFMESLTKMEMGFSFNEVKAVYGKVKGIRPEERKDELASEGLTESVCKQPLFEGEASVEFNFSNDSLYSFSFSFTEKDSERADRIFQAVKKYYTPYYGAAQPEKVEEENHYSQNFVFPVKKSIVPYVYYNLNTNTITFGKRFERAI